MFGKGISKLIGYAVAGAIALAAGGELLASVVSVVLAFRLGNVTPLILVISLTVGILLVVNRVADESPLKMVLGIIAYAVTGYLAVVTFVIVLPYGLVYAGIAAAVAAGVCSFIKDPAMLSEYLQEFTIQMKSTSSLKGITQRIVPVGNGDSFALNKYHNILILEAG